MKTFVGFIILLFLFKPILAQKRDSTYNAKQEIVVDGKRFRVHNNYLNLGAGEGINSSLPWTQFVLNVDFHFHIQKHYFQLGTFLSGDRFLSFNAYNGHLCYGYRDENTNHNIFVCAGPSYSWGFPLIHGVYDPTIYTAFGGYVEGQYVFKFAYDLGLGLSAFGDFNARQTIYGLRGIIYFSGAYRGERKKRPTWE